MQGFSARPCRDRGAHERGGLTKLEPESKTRASHGIHARARPATKARDEVFPLDRCLREESRRRCRCVGHQPHPPRQALPGRTRPWPSACIRDREADRRRGGCVGLAQRSGKTRLMANPHAPLRMSSRYVLILISRFLVANARRGGPHTTFGVSSTSRNSQRVLSPKSIENRSSSSLWSCGQADGLSKHLGDKRTVPFEHRRLVPKMRQIHRPEHRRAGVSLDPPQLFRSRPC
jgi:hypothetical protein